MNDQEISDLKIPKNINKHRTEVEHIEMFRCLKRDINHLLFVNLPEETTIGQLDDLSGEIYDLVESFIERSEK